jgi:adenylate cyclase
VKIIAPNVRERELRRALRKHPSSMTAYDLLLQALDLLYRMDADSFRKARGLLQLAIAHDPGYAPPYTYAALWYIFRVGEIGQARIASISDCGPSTATINGGSTK